MDVPHKVTATQADAYQLLHEGAIALAAVEANGICVDVDYATATYAQLAEQLEEMEQGIRKTEFWRDWECLTREAGGKVGLKNDEGLRALLFDHRGLKSDKATQSGKYAVDIEVLHSLIPQVPELEQVLRWRKLDKIRNTYFSQLLAEVGVDGVLHPNFHLHKVVTYRSSSSNPNFQNIPVRDEEAQSIVRRVFLPRPGRCLMEVDYGGIEVRIAACYHKDPTMLTYINDPTKDMHRDMGMECYKLTIALMTKWIRYLAKNKFVFPEFYGSYWEQVARDLWEAVSGVKLADGTTLARHLKTNGLGTPEKFALHIKEIERRFWKERFPVYDDWRDRVWAWYESNGYVDLYTGFRCQDLAIRNQVINRPIQGTAFHCLLKSLILIVKKLVEEELRALAVGQIHDSALLDVPLDEVDEVMSLVRYIMTRKLRELWPWIIVPLEIEAELAPMDRPWLEKKPIKRLKGLCHSSWGTENRDEQGLVVSMTCPCGRVIKMDELPVGF